MGLFDRFKKKETPQTTFVNGVGRMPFPAYRGSEPYIFVSYAHADSVRVFEEIKSFNENGYHVWYDEGISPGNEWTDEIAEALEKCGLFVVFLTPASAGSPNVQNEINYAMDEKKPFLAIHLQETTLRAGVKLQIGTRQAILKYNMTDEEYLYKYTAAFERLGMRQRKKAAAPASKSAASTPNLGSRKVPAQIKSRDVKKDPTVTGNMHSGGMECGYVPQGKAVITAVDGTVYTAAANSFFVRSWERLYDGLTSDYNPSDLQLIPFSEIAGMKLEDSESTEGQYSCAAFSVNRRDGEEKRVNVDSPVEFVFASGGKSAVLGRTELKSVSFDWNAECPEQWENLRFTMKDGSVVCSPEVLTFIGYKNRPQELPQGHLSGWVSGNSWSSALRTKRGQKLPFSQLRHVAFTDVQTEKDALYDRWLSVCQTTILFQDGRSLMAALDFDSLSFFVVDQFGPAEIKVEELAGIDVLPSDKSESKPGTGVLSVGDFRIEHGLLKDYLGSKPDIKLPDEVQIIGHASFGKGAGVIETVDLNRTGALLNHAFVNCPNLREIRIPPSVTMIQEKPFVNCPRLTVYCRRDQLPEHFENNYGGKKIVYLEEDKTETP